MDPLTFTDLICRLEQATRENAPAFAVVALSRDLTNENSCTSLVLNVTGPYQQAEQALAAAGRMDRSWRAQGQDQVDVDAIEYVVVPLWEADA